MINLTIAAADDIVGMRPNDDSVIKRCVPMTILSAEVDQRRKMTCWVPMPDWNFVLKVPFSS